VLFVQPRLVSSDVDTGGMKSWYLSFQADLPAEDVDCRVDRRFRDGARRDAVGDTSRAIGAEAFSLEVAGDEDIRPPSAVPDPASSATWSPSASTPPPASTAAAALTAADWCAAVDRDASVERRLDWRPFTDMVL